jgi:hypothetical protein
MGVGVCVCDGGLAASQVSQVVRLRVPNSLMSQIILALRRSAEHLGCSM